MVLNKKELERICLEENKEIGKHEDFIDMNLIKHFNGDSATFKLISQDRPFEDFEGKKVIEKYKNKGWDVSIKIVNPYTYECTFS